MSEQGEIISPKNLTAYKTVRLGRWAIPITAETMRKIKIAGAIALFAPASWLLAEFFQLRGFVNLTASRIMLFFLWVFFALACWLILSQLIRRKLFVVILSGLKRRLNLEMRYYREQPERILPPCPPQRKSPRK